MESKKEKVQVIELAVKQIIEEERKKNNLDSSFVLVNNDDDDEDEDNRRLLTGLLYQLETSKADGKLNHPETAAEAEEEAPSLAIGIVESDSKTAVEVDGVNIKYGRDDIIEELRRVKRQNFITHCLLSVMIVLTVAWQVSEVSLILRVKEGMSHPFRIFGSMITGMLKGSTGNAKKGERQSPSSKQNIVVPSAYAGLKIPELPQMELSFLDFDEE
ncbi:hypothetical protein LguiB_024609 [Lonicera macranthoides]